MLHTPALLNGAVGVMIARALFAFLALPGVVAFLIPAMLAAPSFPPPRSRLVALIPMTLGTLGLLHCVWAFYHLGHGSLATWDPPKRLVVTGLYRFTRNPMYVSVLTLLLGWTVLAGTIKLLVYTVAVAIAFHLHVVLVEEPWAARTFGSHWATYKGAVPRWLGSIGKRA